MNILEFEHRNGQAKDDHDLAVRKYLVSNGWQYTSRHPGSYWMWSITRQLGLPPSTTYVVDESTALQFQRYWELMAQDFNAHANECPIFVTFEWRDCNCMEAAEE